MREKNDLQNILARSMRKEDQFGGEVYHEVHVRHCFEGRETINKFGMLNLVAGSIHESLLEDWVESEKLFPWVAVAARLEVCSFPFCN